MLRLEANGKALEICLFIHFMLSFKIKLNLLEIWTIILQPRIQSAHQISFQLFVYFLRKGILEYLVLILLLALIVQLKNEFGTYNFYTESTFHGWVRNKRKYTRR